MFVSDVCGREGELYGETDDSPEDFDFIKCENGHLFCVDEVLNDKIKETFYNRRNLGYRVDINREKYSYMKFQKSIARFVLKKKICNLFQTLTFIFI